MSEPSRRAPYLGLLLAAYAAWAIFLAVLAAADVGVLDLFRDPTELSSFLGDHPWKGGLSMAGNLAWGAAAASCLLTGLVLRSLGERRHDFFLAAGVVFLLLAIDDAFTVHEGWAQALIGGPSEPIVLSLLALACLGWAFRFRRDIAESSYVLLILGAGGLGVPYLLDARETIGVDAPWLGVVEEGFEFAGIFTLLIYAAFESWRALVEAGRGGADRGSRPA